MSQLRRRPLRADARQNRERIVDAAIHRLAEDPNAPVAEIAERAGVGRVTLYSHFPSREELVEAALVAVLDRGDAVLAGVDLTGDSRAALARLIEASWLLTAQTGALLEAARAVLPAGRVHDLHVKPAERVLDLLRRGQSAGELRSDLALEWMASALHHLIKGAAVDVSRGTLDPAEVPGLITALVVPAFSASSPAAA